MVINQGSNRTLVSLNPHNNIVMNSIIKYLKDLLNAKYPILRFFFIFAILMGAFYSFAFTLWFQNILFPAYLQFNAEMSAMILNWLGQNVSVVNADIISSHFAISIKKGCDGLAPTAFFLCTILAFSTHWKLKVPGIIFGTLFLVTLNFIRIISLFLVGRYYPQAFELMHLEVWQILFILLAMLFFILWLFWATQCEISQQSAYC